MHITKPQIVKLLNKELYQHDGEYLSLDSLQPEPSDRIFFHTNL